MRPRGAGTLRRAWGGGARPGAAARAGRAAAGLGEGSGRRLCCWETWIPLGGGEAPPDFGGDSPVISRKGKVQQGPGGRRGWGNLGTWERLTDGLGKVFGPLLAENGLVSLPLLFSLWTGG